MAWEEQRGAGWMEGWQESGVSGGSRLRDLRSYDTRREGQAVG